MTLLARRTQLSNRRGSHQMNTLPIRPNLPRLLGNHSSNRTGTTHLLRHRINPRTVIPIIYMKIIMNASRRGQRRSNGRRNHPRHARHRTHTPLNCHPIQHRTPLPHFTLTRICSARQACLTHPARHPQAPLSHQPATDNGVDNPKSTPERISTTLAPAHTRPAEIFSKW